MPARGVLLTAGPGGLWAQNRAPPSSAGAPDTRSSINKRRDEERRAAAGRCAGGGAQVTREADGAVSPGGKAGTAGQTLPQIRRSVVRMESTSADTAARHQ